MLVWIMIILKNSSKSSYRMRWTRVISDASEITEIADKLRWYRYQKGLRQRDAADYAGIDRSTYIHYEEAGRDFYPKEHMEKLAELFEVPLENLLDDYKAALWWLLPVVWGERFS